MSTAISSGSVGCAEFSPYYRLRVIAGSEVTRGVRGRSRGQRSQAGSEVWYDARFRMLRAALIGFASSGKSTLFQLMPSAVGTARAAHGKGETTVGISKVPDARLDRLTAMFNPKKRVPATVEFTDLAVTGTATKAPGSGRAH